MLRRIRDDIRKETNETRNIMTPSDPLYIECCAALRKQYEPSALETAFCKWVGSEFNLRPPIRAIADPTPDGRDRLCIVVRSRGEAEGFYTQSENYYGRDEQKQSTILRRAKETGFLDNVDFLSKQGKRRKRTKPPFCQPNKPDRDPDNWFIAWPGFNPAALQEALSQVSARTRKAFLSDFSKDGLMRLETVFAGTVMMFETEAQRVEAELNGTQSIIAQSWRETILPFDEFGILGEDNLSIKFDSNEVFQRDYKGSWFRYMR